MKLNNNTITLKSFTLLFTLLFSSSLFTIAQNNTGLNPEQKFILDSVAKSVR